MCDEGFPGGAGGEEPTDQCRRYKRCVFDSWVRKIPWRRAWHPTLDILVWRVPWTEDLGGLQSMGSRESEATARGERTLVAPRGEALPLPRRRVCSAFFSPSWAAATDAAVLPGVVEPERPQLLFPGQLSWKAQGSLDLVETGREEVQPRTPPSPSAFQPQMKSHLWRLTPQSVYFLSWVPWCSWKVPRGREFLFPAVAVAVDTASAVGCVTGLISAEGDPGKPMDCSPPGSSSVPGIS